LPVTIGEPIQQIQRTGPERRLHADPFGTDGYQHPTECDETQAGKNEHPYCCPARMSTEDEATSQLSNAQWLMFDDQ
jgi:hypothetical protein